MWRSAARSRLSAAPLCCTTAAPHTRARESYRVGREEDRSRPPRAPAGPSTSRNPRRYGTRRLAPHTSRQIAFKRPRAHCNHQHDVALAPCPARDAQDNSQASGKQRASGVSHPWRYTGSCPKCALGCLKREKRRVHMGCTYRVHPIASVRNSGLCARTPHPCAVTPNCKQ